MGKQNRYALANQNKLLVWEEEPTSATVLMEDDRSFYEGSSGLFVFRNDDSLWNIQTKSLLGFGENLSKESSLITNKAVTASIVDGANYYAAQGGDLFVRGLAHRGQYGDGKLASTDNYAQTSDKVVQVASHSGHALLLKQDGSVWGTGGNIYGPLGIQGYGEKSFTGGSLWKEQALSPQAVVIR